LRVGDFAIVSGQKFKMYCQKLVLAVLAEKGTSLGEKQAQAATWRLKK
jgi:hypothetical protein